jgi:hypothetical protein
MSTAPIESTPKRSMPHHVLGMGTPIPASTASGTFATFTALILSFFILLRENTRRVPRAAG